MLLGLVRSQLRVAMSISDKPNATLDDILVELKSLNTKKKDAWDRLGPLSAFISSVVLGVASLWFTQSYNNRQTEIAANQGKQDQETKKHQTRVLEMQAVEKFLPYLTTNDERQKEVALLVITTLGSSEFATQFAKLKPSEGSQAATDRIMASAVASGTEREPSTAVMESSPIVDKSVGTSASKPKVGWVYLGHFVADEHKWSTQYFGFALASEPTSLISTSLAVRAEKGNINVRLGMPTEGGALLGIRDVLKPGDKVKVREVREWSSAGYMWAEVEYGT